jgi:hypothetical protein
MTDLYSVIQFFTEETELVQEYEVVRQYVTAEEAVSAFLFYTSNVSARVGLTKRIIITDGGDCINYEWAYGKGIVFGDKLDS